MKVNKKIKKISLINYNLLKYQIYNTDKIFINNFKINNTNLELKQALKIIYLYNINKKKIMFVGFPYNKVVKNQLNNFFISKNKLYSNLCDLDTYDLIVLNFSNNKDKKILERFKSSNLPLIIFGNNTNKTYNVNGFFKSKSIQNFCFFLLFSVIKKFTKNLCFS